MWGRFVNNISGIKKPDLQTIPRVTDKISFLYLDQCIINRQDGAITVTDDRGCVHIPAASINAIMLGPGTSISHRAVELIGDAGISIVWVGEHGVRYYASGRPLTHKSNLLIQQAKLVSNQRSHLEVAKKMYQIRFPNEDVSNLTMHQLRGREGSRVKAIYKKYANEYQVKWNGREYDPENFEGGSAINKALSAGHVCLYGVTHAVIAALGCSPGLGFVHVGHEKSFVYDIADLYKAEITIPLAFKLASELPEQDIASEMRKRTRDEIVKSSLITRIVKDIYILLGMEKETDEYAEIIYLWDDKYKYVSGGVLYKEK